MKKNRGFTFRVKPLFFKSKFVNTDEYQLNIKYLNQI